MKERADKLLGARGLAPSREMALALIMAGRVTSAGRPVRKPGDLLDADAALEVAAVLPFVSRGGLKLAEALDRFGLDVRGRVGLDIGASTGGFVDCLLPRGAARVYAVDVDTKQLDWNLTKDPRVVTIEKNARELGPADLPEAPDIVTMDVSFISVLKILPALRGVLDADAELLVLVKPQFEVGRGQVGKGGLVKDQHLRQEALARVALSCRELGYAVVGACPSRIAGAAGNRELFLHLRARGAGLQAAEIEAMATRAVEG